MTGSELRTRRIRAGCSREQIAQFVGVPVETVSEWETDTAPIACPVAVEVVLRDREATTRDHEHAD